MEKLIFPMKAINITQGVNGQYSHQGTYAIDNAGKDTGIDAVYAPCTMICRYKDVPVNGNACFFESVDKVQFADGTIDYATFMFIHCNDVSHLHLGQIIKQGDVFYHEGTAGQATGNHCHIEVAKSKYVKPYTKNAQGKFMLPNSVHPASAFFIDGCVVKDGANYAWKKTTDKLTCWVSVGNGKWQYRKDGRLIKNDMVWDTEYQAWYAFDKDGYMIRSSLFKYQNKFVYLQESGKMLKNAELKLKADNSGYLKEV